MAFTDKGNIGAGVSIAWATENPVKGKLTAPGARVTFSTDLADGVEGILALTMATGLERTGLIWPSNVRWDRNGQQPSPEPKQPSPRLTDGNTPADAGTAVFRFLRIGSEYIGQLVIVGSPAL